MGMPFIPFTFFACNLADVQQGSDDGDRWVLKKDGWLLHSAAAPSECSCDVYDGNIYQVKEDWLAVYIENKHV